MSARTASLLLVSISTMSWCSIAAVAQEADEREIVVSEQALPDSLKFVADEFGLQLAFFSEVAEDFEAPALSGSYTQDQALEALLAETMLEYGYIDNGTVVVRAKDERGDSDSKNSRPAPILMAQNQTRTTNDHSKEVGSGIVTGQVTDARTGANIKGALVTITETGQTSSTDDLGAFRFVNVPLGTQTLSFSYLGTAPTTATIDVRPGDGNSISIALSDSMEEIVVLGQRSARATSLNLQRTAPNNSEVVSADMLGNFTGTTISEALRRVPGITFQQSTVTGQGTNIMIRGLEPDLNTVTLNGLRLPDNSGTGRSGDLSNILADSVSKITVNKTLLPSHDSSGTGGLVEIETKSPLDRTRRYFNVSIEGGESGGSFSDDLLASTTASGTFGENDQFGLSAAFQYRDSGNDSIHQSQEFIYGQYLPIEADPAVFSFDPTSMIDPRHLFPFADGGSTIYPTSQLLSTGLTESLNETIGLTAEWQVNSGTNLRLDMMRIDAERDTLYRDSSDYYWTRYGPADVQALDGEVRQTLSYFNFLVTNRGLRKFRTKQETDSLSLRGVTEVGNWRFDYGGGYSDGSRFQVTPFVSAAGFIFHDPALVSAEATDPIEGRVLSIFAPANNTIQQPLFTQNGFDFLNDPARHAMGRSGVSSRSSSNDRTTAEFGARYQFASDRVAYVELGLFYEIADFDSETRPGVESFDMFVGSGATATDVGLSIDNGDWHRIGAPSGVGQLQASSLDNVFARMRALDGAGITVQTFDVDPRLSGEMTREEEVSGYVETELNFGKLEIIGGARVAKVKTTATKLRRPSLRLADGTFDTAFEEANTELVSFDDAVTDVLPRVLANYRQSDNLVFRGGYYFTVARPTIDSLSRAPRVSLWLFPTGGPQFNQPTLSVSQGNPGLKPAVTHNFDLGAEYYSDNVGLVKLGVFYKRIDNFIDSNATNSSTALDGIELPDDPRFQDLPPDIYVTVLRPQNAEGSAKIWGAELAMEHRFADLPGLFDGLGVYGNYTFSDSSRDAIRTWPSSPVFDDNGVLIGREQLDYVREGPFDSQSRHSGTAAITYERANFDAVLSYSYQDRRLSKFGDAVSAYDRFGFDTYADSVDSLDFRAEYRLSMDGGGQYRFWLEAQNLMDGTSDPLLTGSYGGSQGVPELIYSRRFLGGRSFKLGLSATF